MEQNAKNATETVRKKAIVQCGEHQATVFHRVYFQTNSDVVENVLVTFSDKHVTNLLGQW